ncbi:hypothetical protein KIN20_001634 [Parelaphostrongylus tenuis]|uniref:Uncharacterized protein n=1 Tax=Parelaphostrongylus tenuis TaxID=148309 RepID=A0AAD5QCS2_PARTN|nr:hypothetical protein KIN20_001634 [Parelaphostrongylus tenuis]
MYTNCLEMTKGLSEHVNPGLRHQEPPTRPPYPQAPQEDAAYSLSAHKAEQQPRKEAPPPESVPNASQAMSTAIPCGGSYATLVPTVVV